MEPESRTDSAIGAEPMDCVFTAENSVVVNISLDSQNQDALLQTVEAAMRIVKQEPDLEEPLTSTVLETGVGETAEYLQGMQVTAENQGPVICIVKEEQDAESLIAESLKVGGTGDSDLVNVVIQTKAGESLKIQLPRKTLIGSGLNDQLPVIESSTGDGTYQFECFLCGATFKKAAYLKAHMPVHTGERPFKCTECSSAYATQSQLTIHTRVHTGNKPFLSLAEYKQGSEGQENVENPAPKKQYQCTQCPASFKAPSHLERHVRHKHTCDRPYKCPDCAATFQRPSDLRRHLRRHTGETKYVCNECPAAFKTSSALRWHERAHSGELKTHQCKQCPAAFRAQNDLNTHMRIHTGEKPYKCLQCPGTFAQSSTLRKHMRIHNRKMPIKSENELDPSLIPPFLAKRKRTGGGHGCNLCPARFIRPSDLVRHMRKHTGERPFKCDICGKAFTRQSDLKMHNKIHTNEKSFQCEFCSSAFRSRGDLNKHMRRHTGEKPYMCAQCGQMFRLLGNLKTHMKSHPEPEAVEPEVEDPNAQIFTVQIVDNQVPNDHSYMCPGAVYPATQHIIIQASEAAAAGYFGPPTSTTIGYVSHPKQVAEVAVQVAEVGTQVTPLTFSLPVKMEDKEVSTADAGFQYSPQPGDEDEDPDVQETSVVSTNQPIGETITVVQTQPENIISTSVQPQNKFNNMNILAQPQDNMNILAQPHDSMNIAMHDHNRMNISVQVHNNINISVQPQENMNISVQPENPMSTIIYENVDNTDADSIVNTLVQLQNAFRVTEAEYTISAPAQPMNTSAQPDYAMIIQSHHDYAMNASAQPQDTSNTLAQHESNMEISAQHENNMNISSQHENIMSTSLQHESTFNTLVHAATATVNSIEGSLHKEVTIPNQPQFFSGQHEKSVSTLVKAEDAVDISAQSVDGMMAVANSENAASPQEAVYKHKCTVCKASFKREMHLNRHMLIHAGQKPYKCSHCESCAFFTKAQLTIHQRIHTGADQLDKDETSSSCDAPRSVEAAKSAETSQSADTLKDEDESQDVDTPENVETLVQEALEKLGTEDVSAPRKTYKCWECDAEYANPAHLSRHAKTRHAVDKPYQCPQCPIAFRKPSELKRHIRNHTGQNPYLCPECPAAFTAMSSLKVHVKKAHIGEGRKPFLCDTCPSAFSSQSDLNTHMRVHTGDKPYKCSLCPAEFTQSSNLNKHSRIHDRNAVSLDSTETDSKGDAVSLNMTPGAKPFSCKQCSSSFTRSSDLKIHCRKHTGERPYLCSECPSTFARLTDLKMHNKIHTGERGFLCSECPAAFRSKGDLNKHKRVHTGEKPYMCAQCGSTFRQSGSLKAHLKSHVGAQHTFKGSGLKDITSVQAS